MHRRIPFTCRCVGLSASLNLLLRRRRVIATPTPTTISGMVVLTGGSAPKPIQSSSSLSPSFMFLFASSSFTGFHKSFSSFCETNPEETSVDKRSSSCNHPDRTSSSCCWRPPLPDALPPDLCCEVQRSRGSGPGGQGVNASSNKVHLRVSLAALSPYVRDDVLQHIIARDQTRVCSGSGSGGDGTERERRKRRRGRERATAWCSDVSHTTSFSRRAKEADNDKDKDDDLTESPGAPTHTGGGGLSDTVSIMGKEERINADTTVAYHTVLLRASCHAHRSASENERECRAMILRQLREAANDVMRAVGIRDDRHRAAKEREERRRAIQHPLPHQHQKSSPPAPHVEDVDHNGNMEHQSVTSREAKTSPSQGRETFHQTPHVSPSFAFSHDFSKRVSAEKQKRRRKGNLVKMQRVARRGEW